MKKTTIGVIEEHESGSSSGKIIETEYERIADSPSKQKT